jgi:hypothetical protein
MKSNGGGDGAGAPKTAEDAGGILGGEVMVTAVYLHNWLPTSICEACHGRKPAVNHLCVFDCRAFVKQLGHIDKLTDRSRARVFIGYADGAKVYHILDLAAQ